MSDSLTTKRFYPANLTSYDLFKCTALLLMFADHVGYYLFPDVEWWRVFGRMCVPIWLFLVGYANSRDLSPRLFLCGASLLVANFVFGIPILALNILFTIIAVRLVLDRAAAFAFSNQENFAVFHVILGAIWIPSMLLVEYGTVALVIALYGYVMRHRAQFEARGGAWRHLPLGYAIFFWLIFIATTEAIFEFTLPAFMVMAAGTGLATIALYFFRAREYPALTARLAAPVRWLIRVGGTRTMEIYVIHLIILKLAAALIFPENHHFFQFQVIDERFLASADTSAAPLVEPKPPA